MIATLLLGAISGVTAPTTVPTEPPSWPTYQYADTNNAVFARRGMEQTWSTKVGKSNGGLAIVGDKLYVTSFDKSLYALDIKSGHVLWRAPLTNISMTTPIVNGNLVIIGTGNNTLMSDSMTEIIAGIPEHDFIDAFSVDTGDLRWKFMTIGEDMPTGVVTQVNGKPVFVFSNGDGHAYGLDARDGSLVWKVKTPGSNGMSNLELSNGSVIGSSGFGITGNIIRSGLQTQNANLIKFSGWTWLLDPANGQYRWIAPYGRGLGPVTVTGGIVFTEGTRLTSKTIENSPWRSEIAALDERSGKLLWEYVSDPGMYDGRGSGLDMAAGMYSHGVYYDALVLPSEFAAFEARSGKVLWNIHTDAPVKMGAVLTNGKLYFGDVGGTFYVVDAATGQVVAKTRFPGIFTCSPPVIVGATLFVANGDSVYAVPLAALDRGTIPPLASAK